MDYIQSMILHIAILADRTIRVGQIHFDIIPGYFVGTKCGYTPYFKFYYIEILNASNVCPDKHRITRRTISSCKRTFLSCHALV